MLAPRARTANFQSDFYRHHYYRLLRWLIALLLMMFVLLGAIIYLLITQPPRQFYADTTQGKLLAMPNTEAS